MENFSSFRYSSLLFIFLNDNLRREILIFR